MLATDWKTLDPDAPADLVPAAYAISGVFDLAPLTQISINEDLKLDEAEARRVSPLSWPVPAGRTLDAIVGALEFGANSCARAAASPMHGGRTRRKRATKRSPAPITSPSRSACRSRQRHDEACDRARAAGGGDEALSQSQFPLVPAQADPGLKRLAFNAVRIPACAGMSGGWMGLISVKTNNAARRRRSAQDRRRRQARVPFCAE